MPDPNPNPDPPIPNVLHVLVHEPDQHSGLSEHPVESELPEAGMQAAALGNFYPFNGVFTSVTYPTLYGIVQHN
jgi:hypothetical protein